MTDTRRNPHGRTLADVLLPDGTNVNHELVKDGWCWWYRTYAPGNAVLEELEKAARVEKRGLWADPQPVPPWEWRRRKYRLYFMCECGAPVPVAVGTIER